MGDYEGTELVDVYDLMLKCVILGESSIGKTCLLHHFCHSAFKEHSQHTIGVEFQSRTINVGDKAVKLQLWDTGQERFRSVTRSYYRGAAAAILVYDITRWLADARALASPHLQVVLVGNKQDMEDDREVETLEASKWAQENGVLHLECSALTGHNISAPFYLASRSVLLSIESGRLDPENPGTGVSFGERQLRAVGSSSMLRGGGSSSGKKGRRGSVSLKEMVGNGGRCAC